MDSVVFRCDGDDRIGAGHVSRCLQIAKALRATGTEVMFVGRLEGIAADLAAVEGFTVTPPAPGAPAGVTGGAAAVVVDSYEIGPDELAAAGQQRPLCVLLDDGPVPPAHAVLSYHLDAAARLDVPAGVTAILGPAFTPVRPEVVTARRGRDLARALVTLGGSTSGRYLVEPLVLALLELDPRLEVFVAGTSEPPSHPRVSGGIVRGGLTSEIAAADVAVSGSGSTPYELACAGVPALLVAVADNQVPVGRAFAAAGIAGFVDARAGVGPDVLAEAVRELGDERSRAAMAEAGPAKFDGYGAFRAAAALRAAFAGKPLPRVIVYRPANAADAGLLLAWRNDPVTRAASRQQARVEPDEHQDWLARVLADPSRILLVAECGRRPVGTVRFDRGDTFDEIAVTVAPEARGEGVGSQLIREATELHLHAHGGTLTVRAEIRTDNLASLVAFERAGFRPHFRSAEFAVFESDRESVAAVGRG